MLAVEQRFGVCIEEIISNKTYGAKSVRKSREYYDIIITLTTLLISKCYLSEVESRTKGSRPRPRT